MSKSAFPDPADALSDPPGLIAVGGDLTSERLTDAYRHGIFPWFEAGQPILWWTPPTRAVIETSTFTPSRSLRQWLRRAPFRVELNTDFNRVIEGCRSHRMERDEGTWITEEMQSAYQTLHEQGLAHAISCYLGQELVGGLYGVGVGSLFCGESMFSRESNASKIAFAYLMKVCRLQGIDWVDCQLPNPHLMSLGAVEMPRQAFINLLHERRDSPDPLKHLCGQFADYECDDLLVDTPIP